MPTNNGYIFMCTRSTKKIIFEKIFSSDTLEFKEFYEIYSNAFPLEDEREPPEGLIEVIEFNQNKNIQKLYGPYHEVIAAIRFDKNSPIIGGVVFSVNTSQAHIEAGIPSSVQAFYVFIDEKHRGAVSMRDIVDYCKKTALDLYGKPCATMKDPIILFEVNNPLRMSEKQITEDTLYSGINPAQRYMFWQQAISSMPLNFSYVQPRLREDSQPIHYLDLFCTKELPEGIPAKLLLNHLKAFCSIAVLKGKDASKDPDFHAMEKWLNEQETVFFMDKNSTEIKAIKKIKRS